MKKKAQVKFGETIGIIIIVYIVVVVGFLWYNNVNTKNITEIYEKDQKNRAFEKYHYIINLHLIKSSQRGDIDEDFDKNSILTMGNYSKTKEGREFLRKSLGTSFVNIQLLDDSFSPYENITLYNNTPDLEKKRYEIETFRTLIPVNDEINSRTEIGILELINYIEFR